MVSAVIITKNEEKNIEDCIKSILWVDEIIVVDAESRDKTIEIANRYTSKVIVRKWTSYSDQKNHGINLAKNNWILSIDADERVSEELTKEILNLGDLRIENSTVRGYKMPIKNYYFDRFLKHGGFFPDYHLRLFNKRYGKFESTIIKVHEGIHVDGAIECLNGCIVHYAYNNIKDYFTKFNKYTTMEANGYFNNKITPTGYNLIIKPLHRFIKSYIIRVGFLDGIAGFLACIFSSFYIFVAELKLIEYYRFNNKNINLLSTLFKRVKKT